MITFENN